ncbi:hypothetical protein GQ43DRAFT_459588 [Delitschia confertaspora ATCC 74209]|uniref:DUF7896 domain-containing protein n=1 Tax=Delitschia confertaspora ATCC 74209 TaxID=1513339 RepID=A0A9P4JWT9_9PLEO|nr:hypothetical protein GQ43DRAFT_459588 [Delitschia confertaspora ATCC 74209]
MDQGPPASTSAATQTIGPSIPPTPTSKETFLHAPKPDTPATSPTFHSPGAKLQTRKVLRLKCPTCNDYPDGFRSEHELRRHTNRVHRRTRKVWVTIDTSPDKSFLANCKACQTGKRYNECYNAASHLRRMHFHPHKRGERKMSAAEARRGGKPGDLDPPMEVLKRDWLREVEEVIGEGRSEGPQTAAGDTSSGVLSGVPSVQPTPQSVIKKIVAKSPSTPTTPSTRMAIDSIVD